MSLAVIGNINVDLLAWPVSEVPPPGTERPIERIELRVGGAAGITGAALARLGADPIVAGCVGDDTLGAAVIDELGRYGVDTRHVRRIVGSATGTCIAFEAPSQAAVDAFHAAAIAAGAADEGGPGLRSYHAHFYAAYVRDLDGNKLSAVCESPE